MRKLTSFLFIIFGLAAIGNAQSGRRIKSSAPVPESTPQVRVTQDASDAAADAPVTGYSESAPNAPRSISPNLKRDKKSKKEAKKQANAPASPTDAVKTGDAADEDVVKVETNLISIPVSVYDRSGLYIPDLEEHNFEIYEDGVKQEIAYFGTSDKPFSVVLLIDVSPSTAYKIEEIQAAASAFVAQLKPQDNVMVISFDESVHVLTEMTADRDKINKAIRRTSFGEATSLYEAVDFSLKKRLDKIDGRKAVVLFTDGVDTSSMRSSFESTVQEAEESEAVIFPIYYNTFLQSIGVQGGVMSGPPVITSPRSAGQSSAEYARGRAYLNELAAATGGRVFRPESNPGGLTTAFESIAEELRRQYNIGYYPAKSGEIGERKAIKVRVNRPRLVIRSRDSYIVGANEKGQTTATPKLK